ncbi:DUF1028 domain-containing protein [Devosia chinhatensis]|uniref:Major pilin protein fimA n=1 Tax=Devosia chinhatensis TaxID=429727 RepID=A0A0F5FK67_9HYPH|nr:DUF1028 domain-containing protein [Devosia chinhatensis]KKB08970.1 hypothetical protein VE26_02695 [Devosia chinhatensis]
MTFSIVARDPDTGAFGVATATAGPMVGALVPHGLAGTGAVATQAMTNPYIALDALAALEEAEASLALAAALEGDEDRQRRQAIVVDRQGRTSGWTGEQCEGAAGHVLNDNVAVAGNMLTDDAVLDAVMTGFGAPAGHFGRALYNGLASGARAGGDKRGLGSAALKVFGTEAYPALDLRIDWSADPIGDLEALLALAMDGNYADFFAQVPRRG